MNAPAPFRPARKTHPLTRQNTVAVMQRAAEHAEQKRALRALERLQATRPLRPPPYDFGDRQVSAARLALARDIALGIVGTTRGAYVHAAGSGDE